jgi:drug/metabolite transporter (DMT)-like permease
VLVVAVGYAIGPAISAVYLGEESSLALAAVSLAAVAVVYVPIASTQLPSHLPPAEVLASVVVLGTICTAVAFVAFFELIKAMPPTKATLITYFNPVVAVALGVAVLGESLRWATIAGFGLILWGSFLAARSRTGPEPDPATQPDPAPQ